MLIPDRVIRYEESIFPCMTFILDVTSKTGRVKLSELYEMVIAKGWEHIMFIQSMDALYYLKSIELDDKNGEITYAGNNHL